MADTQIAAIRARLNFTTAEEFIEAFAPLVSAGGMFLRTRQVKPVGSTIRFDFSLASGERLLFGEGVVRQVKKPSADNPSAPTGMLIKFTKLNRSSKDLVRRIVAFKSTGVSGGFEPAPRREAPPRHDPDAFYDDGDRTMAGMPAAHEEADLNSGSARGGGDIHASLANLRALVGRREPEPELAPPEPEPPSEDEADGLSPSSHNVPSSDTGIPGAEVAFRERRPLFPQRTAAPAAFGFDPTAADALPPGTRVSAVAEEPSHPPEQARAAGDLGEFGVGMDDEDIDDVLGNLFGGGSGGGFDFGGDAFGDGVADAGGFFGAQGGEPASPFPSEFARASQEHAAFETDASERTPEAAAPRGLAAFAHLTSEDPIHIAAQRDDSAADIDLDIEVDDPMSEAEYSASHSMFVARDAAPASPAPAPYLAEAPAHLFTESDASSGDTGAGLHGAYEPSADDYTELGADDVAESRPSSVFDAPPPPPPAMAAPLDEAEDAVVAHVPVLEPEADEDYFDPFGSSGVDDAEEPAVVAAATSGTEAAAAGPPQLGEGEEYVDLDAPPYDDPESVPPVELDGAYAEAVETARAEAAAEAQAQQEARAQQEAQAAEAAQAAEQEAELAIELEPSSDDDVLDLGAPESEEAELAHEPALDPAPGELAQMAAEPVLADAPEADAEPEIDFDDSEDDEAFELGDPAEEEAEFTPEAAPVEAAPADLAFDEEEDIGPRGGGGLGAAVTDNFFGDDEDAAELDRPIALFGDPEAERMIARAEVAEVAEMAPFAEEVALDAAAPSDEGIPVPVETEVAELEVGIPSHLLIAAGTEEGSELEAEEEAEVQRLFAERRTAQPPPPAAESRPLGRIALRRASVDDLEAERREAHKHELDGPAAVPPRHVAPEDDGIEVDLDGPIAPAAEAPLDQELPDAEGEQAGAFEPEPEPEPEVEPVPEPEVEVREALFVPPAEVEGELESLLGDIGGTGFTASETARRARGPIQLRFARAAEEVAPVSQAEASLEDLLSLAQTEIEHVQEHHKPMDGDAVLDEVLGELPPPPPPPTADAENPFAVADDSKKKKKGFFSRLFGGD